MGKHRPALHQAIEWLTRNLPSYQESGRLPPLQLMATEAGVSSATMAEAMGIMQSAGVLARAGGRTRKLLSTDKLDRVRGELYCSGRLQKWEGAAQQIRQDLAKGLFDTPDLLGSCKELGDRYGVSYRTLRKSLRMLEQQGFLRRTTGGYIPQGPASKRTGSTVGLVILGRPDADIRMLPSRTIAMFTALEQQCARAGVGLEVLWYLYAGESLVPDPPSPDALQNLLRASGTLGVVVWAAGLGIQPVAELAAAATRAGKPVAVLDEVGQIRQRDAESWYSGVRVFTLSNTPRCGYLTGRYLTSLGHRRAVYVQPLSPGGWSAARLAGLRMAFAEAGCEPDAVVECSAKDNVLPRALPPASEIVSPALARAERARIIQILQTEQTELQALYNREHTRPALDRALKEPLVDASLTAWVGANDDMAILCLQYLRSRKIAVPGRVSVVGFDDSQDVCFHGLTSFSLNVPSVVRAGLTHVLGGPQPWPRSQRMVEVDGFVVRLEEIVKEVGVLGPARLFEFLPEKRGKRTLVIGRVLRHEVEHRPRLRDPRCGVGELLHVIDHEIADGAAHAPARIRVVAHERHAVASELGGDDAQECVLHRWRHP